MNDGTDVQPWQSVLDFWFPEGRSPEVDAQTHHEHWSWRMRGGADGAIVARFADLTTSAAASDLDEWASDHFERLDLVSLREDIAAEDPAQLQPTYRSLVKQAGEVRKVIAAFGRHPHRNRVLGRPSTAAEGAYIAPRDFPHERAFQD